MVYLCFRGVERPLPEIARGEHLDKQRLASVMRSDDGVLAYQILGTWVRQRQPPVHVLALLRRLVPPVLRFEDWRSFPSAKNK
jgi:hypothetical protein